MPLQIRRGTEAQRVDPTINLTLAAGEPLWVESTKKLYIGDGTTLAASLLPVTGFNEEDARDAAASLFTAGTHSNITFTYNDGANSISAAVNLANYNGVIKASAFNGTLSADDSTILVDAVDSKINLDGTVKGHIVPATSVAYDLGSATNRFRDLYLSGSSIKLGGATITASGSSVELPVGSTVGGVPIGSGGGADGDFTGTFDGDVTGTFVGDAAGSFVGDASGTFVGDASGTFVGDASGSFVGDLMGSVLGDDSTVIVDGIDGSLNTSGLKIQFDRFTTSTGYFNFGNETSTNKIVFNTNSASLDIEKFGLSNGAGSIGQRINTSRGSVSAPSALSPGDIMYSDTYRGWDGAGWVTAAGVYVITDSNDTVDTDRVPGKLFLATTRNNGTNLTGVSINSYGNVGINKQYADTVDATLDINGFAKLAILTSAPVTLANGMIAVADGTSWNPLSNGKQSLVAYLGGSWVQIAVAP